MGDLLFFYDSNGHASYCSTFAIVSANFGLLLAYKTENRKKAGLMVNVNMLGSVLCFILLVIQLTVMANSTDSRISYILQLLMMGIVLTNAFTLSESAISNKDNKHFSEKINKDRHTEYLTEV